MYWTQPLLDGVYSRASALPSALAGALPAALVRVRSLPAVNAPLRAAGRHVCPTTLPDAVIDIPPKTADARCYIYSSSSRLDLGVPMGNDDYGHFQLSLFQSWQLRRDARIVHVAVRQQRLITALAVSGPRPRSYLAGLLWPENSEKKALDSLRVSVHIVTRQLPGLLINRGAELSLSEQVDIDLHRVRALIRELNQEGFEGNVASCLHQLRDADLLPGWYDDWILFEQSRLRQDRLHAFLVVARDSLARWDYPAAVAASEAALELEPLYESAVGLLIQAERGRGNNASALRSFERYQSKLKEDMGMAPSEALLRLVADLW